MDHDRVVVGNKEKAARGSVSRCRVRRLQEVRGRGLGVGGLRGPEDGGTLMGRREFVVH